MNSDRNQVSCTEKGSRMLKAVRQQEIRGIYDQIQLFFRLITTAAAP